MNHALVFLGITLSMLACVGQRAVPASSSAGWSEPPSASHLGNASGAVNPFSNSGQSTGLTLPRRTLPNDPVQLVVRPDVLTTDFAVRAVQPTGQAALEAARSIAAEALNKLTQATSGAASMRLRGMSTVRVEKDGRFEGVAVSVDGVVDVRLPSGSDFWARSQVLMTVITTMTDISDAARSKTEPLREIRFDEPKPAVEHVESYRPKLMERWVERARSFATLAESKEAPLSLVDCAPPAAITQMQVSLEEIVLQLAQSCRIDVSTGAGPLRSQPTAGRPQ